MRAFLFSVLLCLTVSCFKETDNFIKGLDYVDIIEVSIPDTTVNLEKVQINAKAKAPNGCWKDLYFHLNKLQEFDYELKAYGTYEGLGACPQWEVLKDTVIDFMPTQAGTYLFRINHVPNHIDIDTMIVE